VSLDKKLQDGTRLALKCFSEWGQTTFLIKKHAAFFTSKVVDLFQGDQNFAYLLF